MAHYKHTAESRVGSTPHEHLKAAASLGQLCMEVSGRGDIIAYLGDGAGGGAPAAFNPALAELEVNLAVACPGAVDIAEVEVMWRNDKDGRNARAEYPVLTGAVVHEAMHAKHSLWSIPDLYATKDMRLIKVAEFLEESRIEGKGVMLGSVWQPYLRACALKLVLSEFDPSGVSTRMAAALSALLTLARVDAGVLEDSDVAGVRGVLEAVLGADLIAQLQEVWVRVHDIEDDADLSAITGLAREYLDILDESSEDSEAEQEGQPGGSGSGSGDGDGEGEPGQTAMDDFMDALKEALEDGAEAAEVGAVDDIYEQQLDEAHAEEVATRRSAANERMEHQSRAAKVFGKGTGPASGSTRSKLVAERAPKPKERAAAVVVARMLEKARYRDRSMTDVVSAAPPGRLRTRAAVQGAAEKARGAMSTAQPWKARHRRTVEDPKLTVGVMVDISGSMHAAMEPMGVTAWVFSEAAKRLGADVAQVYYGTSVFSGKRKRERVDKVRVFSAPDMTEHFNDAFMAINGELGLLDGSGARLLVITSDVCYSYAETAAAKQWVSRCVAAGVGVLVITFDRDREPVLDQLEQIGAHVISGALDPATAAQAIGVEAAKALERAGRRRDM